MTTSDAQDDRPTGHGATGASDAETEASLQAEIAELDRLIALGLRYLGDSAPGEAPPADQREAPSLHDEIARRERLIAALEELETRRQEVRSLRRRLDTRTDEGEARAPMPAPALHAPSPPAEPAPAPAAEPATPTSVSLWARAGAWAPVAYLLLIVIEEALIVLGAAPVGMLLGLVLITIIPLHATFVARPQAALLASLTLLPLLRVVSLALPLADVSPTTAYLIAGLPVLFGAAATIWALQLTPSEVGLRLGRLPVQLGIAMFGLPLGLLQYAALTPAPLGATGPAQEVFAAVVLVVAVAFVEEVVYRGVLQATATAAMGPIGLLFTSVAFAAGYLGNASLASMVIAFGFGLVFAVLVARTGSLLGVTLAHGLALVVAMLVLPMLAAPVF